MVLSIWDWLIVAAYLLLSLSIGLYYRKRAGKNLSEFFLSGRNLPWWIAGTSMVATTFAADTPLAVTELVGQNGIAGNWLWWNFVMGGMLTVFFFAKLWHRAGILTEVELIEVRYSGKAATFLRGFKSVYLGIFMNCIIIGWVNVALLSLLQVFFGIPKEDALLYVAGAMLLTAIYSSLSGLWGVAITDVVQFVIAMTGCIVLAIIVLNSPQIGGVDGLKEKLPSGTLDFFPHIGNTAGEIASTLTLGAGSFLAFIAVMWWSSWYPGQEPGGGGYVAQRMMSAKNEKHALYATLFFQIAHYCLRPWPWIIVGLCTVVLYPELSFADKKLGYVMAMKEFLPAGLKGLLLIAFLAAYMSTIATQLNWGTSYIVNDLYKRFLGKNKNEKHYVTAGKVVTLLVMTVGLFATTQIDSIKDAWTFIMECGAGLGLVLILRWFWWRINVWSEISATLAPFIAFSIARYLLKMEFPESFFFTVASTTVIWLIVTFLTPPEKPETLKKFYEKVQPCGWWKPFSLTSNFKLQPLNLFICWISGIALVYSCLFFFGKLIFCEWNEALLWGSIVAISFILLKYFMNRSDTGKTA